VLNRIWGISVIVFVAAISNAAEKKSIFQLEPGIGFRFVGAAYVQDSTKTQFQPALTMGCEVDLDVLAIGNSRIGIEAGYLHHFGTRKAGTEQINLLSSRQQVDFILDYKYHWTYFGVFVGLGASMGIFSVTTRMYNLGEPTISPDRASYVFNNKTLIEEEKSTGTIFGPTAVLGGEFDLGRLVFRNLSELDNFWFFNIAVQYAIRDLKHELCFFAVTKVSIRKLKNKTK
jgi:hypothetical protein